MHLAFIIVAGSHESEHINLEGSRNVFESQAQVAALARERSRMHHAYVGPAA